MTMMLKDGAFDRLDRKLSDIQVAIDRGILNPETALRYLREARVELYALRTILRSEVILDDSSGPETPDAA